MKNKTLPRFTGTQLFYMAFTFFIFMMLFNLLHSPLWWDEWIEYTFSQNSIRDKSIYNAIISTFQPPLYNFIMHFWLKISTTILWFRLFNVFCGMLAGWALYESVKCLTNRQIATGTLLALGCTYQWIYCIQECSEYALMLTFLCLAIYFYVQTNDNKNLIIEILFILSCVGAMYSQYGAFFVIFPLLIIHFVRKCISGEKREIIKTSGMYLFSFVFFAIPLYVFFAKIQIEHNAISENSNIVISLGNIRNLPLVFGKLMGYFLNINDNTKLYRIISLFGAGVIIFAAIILGIKKSTSWLHKSLIVVLLTAYILFYFLVTFNIYAMVHPNQSSGYYSRYAYFFIPLFYIIVPTILFQISLLIRNLSLKKWYVRILACTVFAVFVIAYPGLLKNWYKAYDDEFTRIWVYNAGFKETTYLTGISYGFNHYTIQSGCKITGKVLASNDIDLENLPDSFWLWRTNGGGDIWQATVDAATEQEYEVIIYADHGYQGQLAYCSK